MKKFIISKGQKNFSAYYYPKDGSFRFSDQHGNLLPEFREITDSLFGKVSIFQKAIQKNPMIWHKHSLVVMGFASVGDDLIICVSDGTITGNGLVMAASDEMNLCPVSQFTKKCVFILDKSPSEFIDCLDKLKDCKEEKNDTNYNDIDIVSTDEDDDVVDNGCDMITDSDSDGDTDEETDDEEMIDIVSLSP